MASQAQQSPRERRLSRFRQKLYVGTRATAQVSKNIRELAHSEQQQDFLKRLQKPEIILKWGKELAEWCESSGARLCECENATVVLKEIIVDGSLVQRPCCSVCGNLFYKFPEHSVTMFIMGEKGSGKSTFEMKFTEMLLNADPHRKIILYRPPAQLLKILKGVRWCRYFQTTCNKALGLTPFDSANGPILLPPNREGIRKKGRPSFIKNSQAKHICRANGDQDIEKCKQCSYYYPFEDRVTAIREITDLIKLPIDALLEQGGPDALPNELTAEEVTDIAYNSIILMDEAGITNNAKLALTIEQRLWGMFTKVARHKRCCILLCNQDLGFAKAMRELVDMNVYKLVGTRFIEEPSNRADPLIRDFGPALTQLRQDQNIIRSTAKWFNTSQCGKHGEVMVLTGVPHFWSDAMSQSFSQDASFLLANNQRKTDYANAFKIVEILKKYAPNLDPVEYPRPVKGFVGSYFAGIFDASRVMGKVIELYELRATFPEHYRKVALSYLDEDMIGVEETEEQVGIVPEGTDMSVQDLERWLSHQIAGAAEGAAMSYEQQWEIFKTFAYSIALRPEDADNAADAQVVYNDYIEHYGREIARKIRHKTLNRLINYYQDLLAHQNLDNTNEGMAASLRIEHVEDILELKKYARKKQPSDEFKARIGGATAVSEYFKSLMQRLIEGTLWKLDNVVNKRRGNHYVPLTPEEAAAQNGEDSGNDNYYSGVRAERSIRNLENGWGNWCYLHPGSGGKGKYPAPDLTLFGEVNGEAALWSAQVKKFNFSQHRQQIVFHPGDVNTELWNYTRLKEISHWNPVICEHCNRPIQNAFRLQLPEIIVTNGDQLTEDSRILRLRMEDESQNQQRIIANHQAGIIKFMPVRDFDIEDPWVLEVLNHTGVVDPALRSSIGEEDPNTEEEEEEDPSSERA